MAHYLGRLCEEFHCLPSQAWDELMRVEVGMLEQIIEYRAYAATKAAYDQQQNPKAEGPLWQLVKVIDFELAGEALRQREQEAAE